MSLFFVLFHTVYSIELLLSYMWLIIKIIPFVLHVKKYFLIDL